jgi:hypothetical protein
MIPPRARSLVSLPLRLCGFAGLPHAQLWLVHSPLSSVRAVALSRPKWRLLSCHQHEDTYLSVIPAAEEHSNTARRARMGSCMNRVLSPT